MAEAKKIPVGGKRKSTKGNTTKKQKTAQTTKKSTPYIIKKLLSYLEFSKLILLFYLCACIYVTYHGTKLCYYAMDRGFSASIPWFSAIATAIWSGFATALSFYTNKSKEENKIKIEKAYENYP